jgi:CubicO group peptidase (beta-lactamase class C family)
MRRLHIVLAISFVALPGFWLIAPKQQITSVRATDFDNFITALMAEESIPGIAIAVIRQRQIVRIEGRGFADVASRRPMTADTPMNIASVSKPILGITLLQLRDQGLLDLDEDIGAYLPIRVFNPHFQTAPITLRQLATHTSSIADFAEPADYAADADSPVPLAEHLRGLLTPGGERYHAGAHYLKAKPGNVREYSNLGAGVAGAVAEAVAGKPLAALGQDGIFAPLGMRNTSWLLRSYPPGVLATRYEVRQCIPYLRVCATSISAKLNYLIGTVFDPPAPYRTLEPYPQYGNPNYPDGGVHSSVRDLAILTLAILEGGSHEGAILTQASFEEMFRLQLPPSMDDRQRFFWRDRDGLTGHAGSDRGVFTSLYFDMAGGNAIIVLMNRTPDGRTEAAMERIYERASSEMLRDGSFN